MRKTLREKLTTAQHLEMLVNRLSSMVLSPSYRNEAQRLRLQFIVNLELAGVRVNDIINALALAATRKYGSEVL